MKILDFGFQHPSICNGHDCHYQGLNLSFVLNFFLFLTRIENGYCGIKYSQPTTDIYSFTLSGDGSTSKSKRVSFESTLRQGSQTRGPRAAFGPPRVSMRPAALAKNVGYEDFIEILEFLCCFGKNVVNKAIHKNVNIVIFYLCGP